MGFIDERSADSPMRNEEFYIPVLDAMLDSPLLEEIEKVRPKARRKLVDVISRSFMVTVRCQCSFNRLRWKNYVAG